jgi:hypothetical protein
MDCSDAYDQVGNMGLAFRTMIDWMTGLGPIESPNGN